MPQLFVNVNSVGKALKLITTLAANDEGMATGELSEKLGFSKPTVSRLLSILHEYGFVRRGLSARKYTLGSSALDIGKAAYKHIAFQLVTIAESYLKNLRDTVKESALLEVMAGDSTILIYRANGPSPVEVLLSVGTRLPLHVSAGAKAILAFSPSEMVETILRKKMTRFTPKTITNPEALRNDLVEIRRTGVAFCRGEYDIDFNAVAAPIFDHEKNPVAAVIVTMPAYRVKCHNQSRIISQLKETAANISEELIRYRI